MEDQKIFALRIVALEDAWGCKTRSFPQSLLESGDIGDTFLQVTMTAFLQTTRDARKQIEI